MNKQRTTTIHGYPILKRKPSDFGGEIVIARRDGTGTMHKFVVWRMSPGGVCEGGDYFETVTEAEAAFRKRR